MSEKHKDQAKTPGVALDEYEHYEDLAEAPGLPTMNDILRWQAIAAKAQQHHPDWKLVGVKVLVEGKIMGIFRKSEGT